VSDCDANGCVVARIVLWRLMWNFGGDYTESVCHLNSETKRWKGKDVAEKHLFT